MYQVVRIESDLFLHAHHWTLAEWPLVLIRVGVKGRIDEPSRGVPVLSIVMQRRDFEMLETARRRRNFVRLQPSESNKLALHDARIY